MILWVDLIVIFLFLFGTRVKKDKTAIFTKEDSLCLKGLFACFVIIHHIGQQFVADKFNINYKMGVIAVAGFFMLSAYGLMKSCAKDKEYWKKIFLQKIPKLYLLHVFINLIYYLIFHINKLSAKESVLRIFGFDFLYGFNRLNVYSWFITTILIFYVFFGLTLLIAKLFDKIIKHKSLFVAIVASIFVVVFDIVVLFTSIPGLYSSGIFGLVFGLFLPIFEPLLFKLKSKPKIFVPILVLALAVLTVSLILLERKYSTQALLIFVVLMFLFCSAEKNKLFAFLGTISLEIYLLQYIFFKLPITQSNKVFACAIAIIGSTIVVSYLLNLILKIIKNLLKIFVDFLKSTCKHSNKKEKQNTTQN